MHNFFVTSNQVSNGGAVETYPSACGCNFTSTKQVSAFTTLTSSFAETDNPTIGEWNAGYDIWTSNASGGWNFDNEVMVDNEQGGHPENRPYPAGSVAVTIDGVAYHAGHSVVGTAPDGGNKTFTYFLRDSFVKSGSINIKDFFTWLNTQGWVSNNTYMVAVGYGVEVSATQSSPGVQGPQRFDISNYTLQSDQDNV